jgi:hypothetical protein
MTHNIHFRSLVYHFTPPMSFTHVWDSVNGNCSYLGTEVPCNATCGISPAGYIVCIDSTIVGFCVDLRSNLFFLWGGFALLIFISQVLCLMRCPTYMPAPITFFHNYVVSGLFACFITGLKCITNDPVMTISSIFITVFPMVHMIVWCCIFPAADTSCYPWKKLQPRVILDSFFVPVLSYEQLIAKIAEIRRNPPNVEITGAIRTMTGHGKNRHYVTNKVVEKQPYCSWEERCEEVKLPPNGPVVLIVNSGIALTYNMAVMLEDRRVTYQQQLQVSDPEGTVTTFLSHSIDNSAAPVVCDADTFVCDADSGPTCFHRFVRSCFGKFVYFLFAWFGFHSVYESLICASVTPFQLDTVKWVSDTDEFHCPAYTADISAPTTAPPDILL